MVEIDLPDNIEIRLELLSLSTGRTVQFYAREAILEYLDEVEDRYLTIDRINEDSPLDHGEIYEGTTEY